MKGRLLTFLFFFLLAGVFEFATTSGIPGGDDGYRHVKLAHRYWTEGRAALEDPFRLVGFWPKPMDGWFGYHLLLAPLTALLPLIAAAKVLVMIEMGCLALVLWLLLEDAGVEWRFAWVSLAMCGSSMVFYRAMYARPFLLSLILLLLAALFAWRGSRWGVVSVSAAHAFCYSIVFLVGLPVGLVWLIRRDRASWMNVLACVGGIAVGMMASPFFPENARFTLVQTLGPLTAGVTHDLDIGGELKPVSLWWFAGSVPVVVLFVAALVVAWRRRVLHGAAWLFLSFALVTLVGSLRVARFSITS